jgi:hypothetical protein
MGPAISDETRPAAEFSVIRLVMAVRGSRSRSLT